jgi:hypothetical protein
MKNNDLMNEQELISYLKTTKISTILVEGTTDAYIYRMVELNLSDDVSILQVGGRSKLLDVFKRRAEFSNAKVLFLADKDMWLFSGIPQEYSSGIIFTTGYSIENDIYTKDLVEGLMTQLERKHFNQLLDSLSYWFGYEVESYLQSGISKCSIHVNQICPDCDLSPDVLSRIEASKTPDPNLVKEIRSEYRLKLRGKNLFESVLRYVSTKSRESKFSYMNLYEFGVRFPNSDFNVLLENVRKSIGG